VAKYDLKVGLQVDGLTESLKALSSISKGANKAARESMRDAAKLIQGKAQNSIGNHPGYAMGTKRSMIGRSVTKDGAGVKLRRSAFPYAGGGEYGAFWANVHGPRRPEYDFKRSIYAVHKKPTNKDLFKNKGGYWIQPAIRKNGRQVNRQIVKDMEKLFVRYLRPDQVRWRN
jgi:hypothetical protein